MKKVFLLFCLSFVCVTFLAAQEIDGKVREAINHLASRLTIPMDISIGTVTLDGTDTPSGFSRFLTGRITHYADNNDLFRVVPLTRGAPPVRPIGSQGGTISGSFMVLGDRVDVTLRLVSDSGSSLGSQYFNISVAELRAMGIAIEPENMQAVREREQIMEQLNIQPAQDTIQPVQPQNITSPQAFEITAWPDTDTYTYIEGNNLRINILSNRNCYFLVYHVDKNNQMKLIYPNSVNTNNYLQANQQRTIPEAPQAYSIIAPFGQDTIIVLASTQQFTDFSSPQTLSQLGTRGLGMLIPPSNQTAAAETATTRFNFTSLPATHYDEIYSYRRPVNMLEAIQALQTDVRLQGGSFIGNEREGTFTTNAAAGSYRVIGDTIILSLRYTGNQLTIPQTRGAGFNFSIERPRNISQAVNAVRTGIEDKGGTFTGNEQNGRFEASGIAGQYSVGDRVTVTITKKPFVIPNSMIEREVRSYFSGY